MIAKKPLLVCLTLGLLLVGLIIPAAAQADFGIKRLSAETLHEDGSVDLRAGSHPYEFTLGVEMNQNSEGNPEGTLREIVIDLPPGMVGDPLAVPRCTGAQFEGQVPHCPPNTQLGVARLNVAGIENTAIAPVYNLTPPLGVVASFGFSIINENSLQEASLRPSDYGARVSDITIPTAQEIQSVTETIWGVPAEASHDSERGSCLEHGGECSSGLTPEAFLTLPTSCGAPLQTTVTVTSVQEPEAPRSESVQSLGEGGAPEGLNGCDKPPFAPTIASQPGVKTADSPSGLHFSLRIPQAKLPANGDPEGTATASAHLRDAVVTLPAGLALNPSSGDGLGACTPAQIGLGQAGAPQCPDNSKIGAVKVQTPLIDHTLPGSVYLAKQGENPFNSLLALYIVVDDPTTGILVKLAGEVEPDPLTGQLRTVVKQNPQVPFEDFEFDFAGGPKATLTTPPTCGAYATTADLTPWSSPARPDAVPSDSFTMTRAPGGSPCAHSEAQMPNAPAFEAGTTTPLAGAYSPFVVKLSRENGSQRFGALNMTLPPGVTANFNGVAECSEAQIAQAKARSNPGEGALEKASPSCPAASQIGSVNVGAGSGNPIFVQGNVYLAGPYKGAPFSLAIIVPVVTGPFDVGTVLARAALYVNEETGQGTVKSDPIPQILQGIPADVRSIAVNIDRSGYVLNPTSCEAKAVTGELITTTGQIAPLKNRFQVGGCKGLDYTPKLSLKFKGATHRRAHPKLIATLSAKPGEANTAFAQVKLPKAAFLDNAHIGTICTRPQFAAEACPAGSIYGEAEATTPLLDYPLTGNVYLRSSSHELPDLVVDLHGPPPHELLHVVLAGRTDSAKGALRNTFEAAPDVPVTKFRLELFGGKRGLVELSDGLCKNRAAAVKLKAHNGKVSESNPKVQASCGGGKKGGAGRGSR